MKTVNKTVLGFIVPVQVYADLAEVEKLAPGQALATINSAGLLALGLSLRTEIVKAVQAASGVPFSTKEGKDAKGVAILERDEDNETYVARALAKIPDAKNKVSVILKSLNLAVDISTKTAKPKGRLGERDRNSALDFLQGRVDLKRFQEALKRNGLGGYIPVNAAVDSPENVERLGWLCKAYRESQDPFRNFSPK